MVENGQSDRLRPEPVGSEFRYLAWGTCFLLMTVDIMPHSRCCAPPQRFPSDWPMLHSTSSPYATCPSLPRPRGQYSKIIRCCALRDHTETRGRLAACQSPVSLLEPLCKSLGQDVDVVYELTTLENKSASGCWMEAAVLWFASAW